MNIEDLSALYTHILRLKKLKRSGWVRNNVDDPESVADHSFALALLALQFANKLNLDAYKAATIALIHDVGESIIGDITPHHGISRQEKSKKEAVAVKEILKDKELHELWLDFEESRTEEGRLVKQLDKLEAYMQARNYQLSDDILAEFHQSTDSVLSDKSMKEILKLLEKTDTIAA